MRNSNRACVRAFSLVVQLVLVIERACVLEIEHSGFVFITSLEDVVKLVDIIHDVESVIGEIFPQSVLYSLSLKKLD